MKAIKRIRENTKRLSKSERRFEDIYNIIFDQGSIFISETATVTRKLRFTYANAKSKIEALSCGIAHTLKKSDRYIGLCADNSLEWIVLFFAILRSGNKPYLVNLRQPASFTSSILKTLDAECVICVGEMADFGVRAYSYDELFKASEGAEVVLPPFANEFAISTSGTTLKEKICIYTGREMSEQILNVESIVAQNPDIVRPYKSQIKMLAFLPLYHIFGFVAMFLWFAFFGATFVFLSDMVPENILRTVRTCKVTHIFAVPLLWHALEKAIVSKINSRDEKTRAKFEKGKRISLALQKSGTRLGKRLSARLFRDVRAQILGESVQFCISGGSFIRPSTLELINALGYTLSNGYGMSEIGISSVELSKKPKVRMLGSIGKPFKSVEYKIDENGVLLVRGESVCKKMIIDGVERINDGFFVTGDVVHTDKRGGYYIDGRQSDIVFGDDGENLNPDFAERAFSLPYTKAISVLGNEDKTKLMLVVQISENMIFEQYNALKSKIEECNSSLPVSYRLREVKFTYDSIMPEKAIKVSRAYLSRMIESGKVVLFDAPATSEKSEDGSESALKAILRQMFAQVLDLPIGDITDNGHFMNDLGGNSLDYFTLINAINERFSVTLNYEGDGFTYTLNDFEKKIKDLIK